MAGASATGDVLPGLVWRKPAFTAPKELFPAGFDLTGVPEARRWLPPIAATAKLAATTVAQRLGFPAGRDASMQTEAFGVELGASAVNVPGLVLLNVKNQFRLPEPKLNPTRWALSLTPATGAISGSCVLVDLVPTQPGKPDRKVTRTARFSGILFPPESGAALEAGDVVGDSQMTVPSLVAGQAAEVGAMRLRVVPAE